MGASPEAPSPTHLYKESASFFMGSPLFSPSSDKRFWSTLRSRIDALLEDRNSEIPTGNFSPSLDCTLLNVGDSGRAKRLKEDALLLIRGFDSVAHTLSQLSNNLDTALQGANDLAKPPTLTEIFHSSLKKSESESKEEDSGRQQNQEQPNKGLKRKYSDHCSEDQGDDSKNEKEQDPTDGKLKKAKNLAVSLATKAASLARELKSIKSDLRFMQERCSVLEEENRGLRDGFSKGTRPEEDDLVRLQLEALLAEKSRLANENANLIRENQCLKQLVEYHQLTSQEEDFSAASYEQVIQEMCLDFSSPPPSIPEGDGNATDEDQGGEVAAECFQTPAGNFFGFSDALNECDDH
ncbi:hypothetical protein L484_025067 [Morus notabilis]|uniref:Uncharacterized protein n=1 Tax=Morus notabilis TaxID=981085 RepID=W9QT67_9ROSA|nr:uncharacterized protein LOC21407785 [Morus notabilis]EXB39372.1 hypothetical protein L484_025067 [Morus notabilis]